MAGLEITRLTGKTGAEQTACRVTLKTTEGKCRQTPFFFRQISGEGNVVWLLKAGYSTDEATSTPLDQ